MPTVLPTSPQELESGHSAFDYTLPNGDSTDEINGEDHAFAIIIASAAMVIEIPDMGSAVYRRPPSGQTYWIEPTATEVGVILEYMPPRFRITNNSGGAATVTVRLVPRTATKGGAVPAP